MDQDEKKLALHELNNVFTIIMSSADLLLIDAVSPDQKSDLENILSACNRGKKIVEDLRKPHV